MAGRYTCILKFNLTSFLIKFFIYVSAFSLYGSQCNGNRCCGKEYQDHATSCCMFYYRTIVNEHLIFYLWMYVQTCAKMHTIFLCLLVCREGMISNYPSFSVGFCFPDFLQCNPSPSFTFGQLKWLTYLNSMVLDDHIQWGVKPISMYLYIQRYI